MPKLSIVALISGFFIFMLALINTALYFEHQRQKKEWQYFALQRFEMAMKLIHDNTKETLDQETKLKIKTSHMSKSVLQKEGEMIIQSQFSDMMRYKGKLFFIPKPPPRPPINGDVLHLRTFQNPLILEDMEQFSYGRFIILSGLINVLMLLFFWVVLNKLLNLKNLKQAIMRIEETNHFNPIVLNSADELGDIAHEFNQAMEKIHLLKEARTFFLRNILHELKTPIMMGKIVSNSLEESKKKQQLQQAFVRLERLLSEMVKIEKLNSNEWKLKKQEYRLVDILDHARDLLMCDTSRIKILGIAQAPLITVDFELFSTAFKNLLDNALKYSQADVLIHISATHIKICSFAKALEAQKLDFSKPFNRETEGATSGLGLGLYIVNAILKKHGGTLEYEYQNQQNCFMFRLGDLK
ncbi:ArsS family sensor histidine kinase [Sulfurospirillum sp. 1612]|uniref:ArsS family sensor histidine kinase n=1 Tax=Sulfurospirillum sp. 1612 TaxID=3094835 RepID=UPI002F949DF0